jgi:hypothetical protein
MSDIEQELGWMKRSPYTEGWPKKVEDIFVEDEADNIQVVHLSDAEILSDLLGDREREAERLREERDGYRFDREALEGLCDTYKRDAERLRESEFNANAKAAILEGKCERLREAIENHKRRILDGPKDKKYPEDYEEEADEQLWAALDREYAGATKRATRFTEGQEESIQVPLDREGMEGMENYIPDWVPPERRPDREGEDG